MIVIVCPTDELILAPCTRFVVAKLIVAVSVKISLLHQISLLPLDSNATTSSAHVDTYVVNSTIWSFKSSPNVLTAAPEARPSILTLAFSIAGPCSSDIPAISKLVACNFPETKVSSIRCISSTSPTFA